MYQLRTRSVDNRSNAGNEATPLLEFFRHHGAWAPGVKLFRRIQFNTKAMIISAVFMLPIVLLGWNYFADKSAAIAFSAKEREGLDYARELLPLITMAQQHRMLATQAAATEARTAEVAELRGAIDRQSKALEAVQARLGESLATGQAHQQVQTTRAALEQAGADPQQRRAAHSAHIEALLALLTQAADGSNLTLDPDLDTYYLMDAVTASLPLLIEATAEMRDNVAAAAAGAALTPAKLRELHRAEAIGDLSEGRLAAGFLKIYSLRPDLRSTFQDDVLRKALHGFHERVTAGQADAPGLLREGSAVVDAHAALQVKMLESLDRLLVERIDGMAGQRNAAAAVVALALLLGFYLFYSFFLVTHGGLREVQKHLEAMTAGDLTTHPTPWGRDEAANLMRSLSDMQTSLRHIVRQVRGASDHIVHSSSEISSGALDLSARTEQAAANLQQSAASMEEISSVVRNTAEGAREAAGLAGTNAQVAQRGGQIIGTMVATMKDIHASSSKIGDIIGTIDGIAFQTNILALNAAVEAARAGESGRGFAVVAAEVRALAQRSAAAAREIKGLITASVSQVESGARVVQTAGDTMAEMVGSAARINQLLAAISTGTTEQASGVTETTKAVQELDHMTQQNAALVEETAAAAASLKEQALNLASKVSSFKLPAGPMHA